MFNTDLPRRADLPTAAALIKSTALAATVALALLITTVLPAEYGIDPTGIGRALGLTSMGEIKQVLAQEAAADAAPPAAAPAAAPTPAVPLAPPAPVAVAASERSDEVSLTLAPGQGAEYKLTMDKGATVRFEWSVRGGVVNFDTHGDPVQAPKGAYHGYGKGLGSGGERGELTAAFDGTHGWFWRNRSGQTVTVTLKVRGAYTAIKRMV